MNRRFTLLILLAIAVSAGLRAQVVLRYGAEMDAGWGDASAVVTPYVSFPAAFVSPYAGNRITKVLIGVRSEGTNVYIYIKEKPQDTKYIYRQKLDRLQPGWNEIVLDTPFDITGTDDIAVGYKASFSDAGGVGYSTEKFSDGDIVYYNSKNKWTSTGGSVCVQAVVEGDRLPQNEMLMGKISDQIAPYDAKTVTFTGVVRNVGGNDVSGYVLKCAAGGDETLLSVGRKVAVNASDTFAIEVPSVVPGVHKVTVSIDKVNGSVPAYTANDTATAMLTVRDKAFMRRVVCEEYGGTWCGFCPRGIVGLELMKEKYPGRFIAISAHGGDELEIDKAEAYSYEPFISSCPGAPMCNVNRKFTGDPYTDIQNLFNMETAAENHIAYTLSAEWNADSSAVSVSSVFKSDIDIAAPLYHIAYTVTEDSVTGYTQLNYYAGGRNGEMYGWEDKEEYTTDFCYNDLARAVYTNYHGELCRDEPMVAGTEYTHTAVIPVPPTVRDKRQIHIVGQIIDHQTGYILNAMSAAPAALPVTDGIGAASAGGLSVGVSRLGGGVEIVVSGGETSGLRAEVHTMSGVRVCALPLASGSACVPLRHEGAYIIRVCDGVRTLRTMKIVY